MNEEHTDQNLPDKRPDYSPSTPSFYINLTHMLDQRRSEEEALTLSSVGRAKRSQIRSEAFSCSSEDLLHSGSLPGSSLTKKLFLDATRLKRLEAYMSLDSVTVSQTRGWRIRAAYRMVCYMARICGGLQGPMTLSDLLHDKWGTDPSSDPFPVPSRTDVYGTDLIIQTLQNLNNCNDTYTFDTSKRYMMDVGMTYLPPHIPDHYYNQADARTIPYIRSSEPDGYDPEIDEPLTIWLDAYDRLAGMLRIHEGTLTEPQSGIFGTVGMFKNNSARLLWPTRDELLLYEQELMLNIFDRLCGGTKDMDGDRINSSVQAVEQSLIKELGYSRVEAVMLTKTALRYGTKVYEEDIDIAKVRELKSLEILSDRAGEGDDPRAQIAARKQIQLVAGLTKDTSGSEAESFRELASKALDDDDDFMGLEG